MNLIKSEWRKLIYARANWGLLIAATLISILSVVVTPFILESQGEMFGLSLGSTEAIDSVYANGISGYIFAIIIGILLMAGEFRHGTAVATFLTSPKRGAVVANKLGIAAIAGAEPRYGTCTNSTPASFSNITRERCAEDPLPTVPNSILPFSALARAMASRALAGL